ncbi:unnamed protein product [Acanthocheilonema viteae]|uniref:RING-type domain-containing protein n=1 Tax=Acanthocheilonema viteae TaxID=6277 RepID=A0A498SN61_ACAVI|nr:unnamed protein product [Acanthocheilonema viteae]
MASVQQNYDEDLIILEENNDNAIVPNEQSSHRVILESHSFIETEGAADFNQESEQSHYRVSRVILSSDEEDDDDNVNKKRRRRPSHSNGNGGHICFEFKRLMVMKRAIVPFVLKHIQFQVLTGKPRRVVCLKCGHLFGESCIERWIRTERAARCPQCKAKARLVDIRRLYVRAIKALDTTELECLKEANSVYKAENDSLRLENQRLKETIVKEEKCNTYKAEIERLNFENAQLRAIIALQEKRENKSQRMPLVAKMVKGAYFSLLTGPVIHLSSEPGSRSIDTNGDCLVVACKITADRREHTVIPVHNRKPRCCRFSPFNPEIVISTGEDNTLCVTSFSSLPRVQHRIPLPASGWCCCWLSEDDVAVGLINGRVLKFNLKDPAIEPFDITCNNGRLPIINLQFCVRRSSLFVTSLKECVLYHHMQPHVLISDEGSINSFCYDEESSNVMVTFAPSQHHETVTHTLYSLDIDSEQKELRYMHAYKSFSKKLTRVIRSAFWTTSHGQLSAVYDESNSHVVLYDWMRKCPAVVKRINDMVVDIKEIVSSDVQDFQLGCLSETAIYFLEARY